MSVTLRVTSINSFRSKSRSKELGSQHELSITLAWIGKFGQGGGGGHIEPEGQILMSGTILNQFCWLGLGLMTSINIALPCLHTYRRKP